jgi:aryl-alcohol dehydrogenase-like predicted oxidoreductase
MMEYQYLGRSDLNISRIGFGCWAIGGHGYGPVDDAGSIRAIHAALDQGINFFDTADVYGFGHSEEVLGRALGERKEQAIIATKFGVNWDNRGKTFKDSSPDRVFEAVDASLRRLRIDCIPLYQLHWHDGKTPIKDTLDALARCREQGKIRYIGCSNFTDSMLKEAVHFARIESLQLQFSLLERQRDVNLDHCANVLRMGILVYGVLGRGLLSGKYRNGATFGEGDTRSRDLNFHGSQLEQSLRLVNVLEQIGIKYHKKPSQVAIRWVLENPAISSALVGIKSVDQAAENAGSAGWRLDPEDMQCLARWSTPSATTV